VGFRQLFFVADVHPERYQKPDAIATLFSAAAKANATNFKSIKRNRKAASFDSLAGDGCFRLVVATRSAKPIF
jgi:hypothetical protein